MTSLIYKNQKYNLVHKNSPLFRNTRRLASSCLLNENLIKIFLSFLRLRTRFANILWFWHISHHTLNAFSAPIFEVVSCLIKSLHPYQSLSRLNRIYWIYWIERLLFHLIYEGFSCSRLILESIPWSQEGLGVCVHLVADLLGIDSRVYLWGRRPKECSCRIRLVIILDYVFIEEAQSLHYALFVWVVGRS